MKDINTNGLSGVSITLVLSLCVLLCGQIAANAQSPNLNGNWTGYYPDGSKSPFVWAVTQTGASLSFLDIGAGTNTRFSGSISGNKITDSNNKTGIVTPGGTITWSDGVEWVRQPAPSAEPKKFPETYKSLGTVIKEKGLTNAANARIRPDFQAALQSAANAELTEIDGPRKYAVGQGEISVGSHVNGMAIVGDWYVVNYPNYDGAKGRLLFWNTKTGDWANVHTFSMASRKNAGGYGFPACMDASGNYLVVATGDSGYIKFFNFSDPKNGVTEMENLEIYVGGMLENVGLAFEPESKRYLLYARNQFWLSKGNSGQDLSSATGWEKLSVTGDNIPHGEAGSPLRYLGGGVFAILSLGSDVSNDSYSFRLAFVTLTNPTTANRELMSEKYTFKKPGEAGGAPSFRWGGTANIQNYGKFFVTLYAAPKRLDASGNYYKWSSP